MNAPRLLDTSTRSYYLAAGAERRTPGLVVRVDEVIAEHAPRISIVTVYEIERGLRKLELRGEGSRKRRLFSMFLSSALVFGLDDHGGKAWNIAADLHARAAVHAPAIVFGEADLLILATAITNGMVLLTADQRLCDRCAEVSLAELVELVPAK